MNKSSPEEDAISCLLVGTEQKKIYILDTEAFTILATVYSVFCIEFRNIVVHAHTNIMHIKRWTVVMCQCC
jgi:hypothetical protein